ncbi:Glycosyl hydrolase family 26, partial [Streptomyces sp. DfronAA-171]
MRSRTRGSRLAALLTVLLAAVAWLGLSPSPAAATGPSTPDAVLSYLQEISGSHAVSGVHNKEPLADPSRYTAQAHDVTGKWPGLWGGELGFRADDIAQRQALVNQAKTEWANGSLVSLTWHMCRPDVATCEFEGGINGSRLSDSEWQQLTTDNSALNKAFKAKLDTAVPYLTQLKDAGVPVLFRPLHEMNEGWAWWGGRPGANGSARLFRITHDYLESKGLDNLLWVWNVKDTAANGGSGGVGELLPRGRRRGRREPRPVGQGLPHRRLVPGDAEHRARQARRPRRGRHRTDPRAARRAAPVGLVHDLVGVPHDRELRLRPPVHLQQLPRPEPGRGPHPLGRYEPA